MKCPRLAYGGPHESFSWSPKSRAYAPTLQFKIAMVKKSGPKSANASQEPLPHHGAEL